MGRSFLDLWAYLEVNQRKGWPEGLGGLNLRRMGIFVLKNEQSSLSHSMLKKDEEPTPTGDAQGAITVHVATLGCWEKIWEKYTLFFFFFL